MIDIVTAVIRNDGGRMLVVRKRGTAIFMKPGGKLEPGEDDITALARELDEELGCKLVSADLLGHFEAPAANEAGFTVRAATYLAQVDGEIGVSAEIEEMAWIDITDPGEIRLAPLMRVVLAAL
ncbi:NUDIX hydrolase [Pseudomonas sp. HMWF010]|nr:NUDIX hydrolase [Caulobacter sp. HMWF009]PTT11354.1 NUDIX hydrolase [Caulobacter sp. HMWF025]PTT78671.1 NUDIX hydrolase [Pseudomonas sp. HMWF010]